MKSYFNDTGIIAFQELIERYYHVHIKDFNECSPQQRNQLMNFLKKSYVVLVI